MDPQATWDELLEAYRDRDADRAEEYATALHEWLQKGGFPPDTGGGRALGDDWHRSLAYAGIATASALVTASRRDSAASDDDT